MNVVMSQYKDLFVQTAKEYLSVLNSELLHLEKSPDNTLAIEAVFRATHSLKGQSAAMGYEETGFVCHVIEDVFYEVKEKHRQIDPQLADLLFKAVDGLTDSVAHVDATGDELPIANLADQLKQATGLTTSGSGKSVRQAGQQAENPPQDTAKQTGKAKAQDMPPEPPAASHHTHIRTIPVKVEQLDDIVGSLEELMVHRLSMQGLVKKVGNPHLSQTQDKIDELIDLIQYQVMKIRTVPLSMILDHYPRAIRDLGRQLNKQLEVKIEGADLELDRTIVERLDEPLIHLIRNAADHGIQHKGMISISAYAEREYAVVTVADDGEGIDWDAIAAKAEVDPADAVAVRRALFSGVSTSEKVSLVSGRGVGLESVKKWIEEMGGSIDVISVKDKGTTFMLRLPLMVSVVRTLIVRVGNQRYAIAATAVDQSIRLDHERIITNVGQEAFRFGEIEIPLIRLRSVFGSHKQDDEKHNSYAVITSVEGEKLALEVDAVMETLETVIRPLPDLIKSSHKFAGVTIVGDGTGILVINPKGFVDEHEA